MVGWTTFALLEAGVTKRIPIMKIKSRCTTASELKIAQGMLNVSHLNLKKTSQMTKANPNNSPNPSAMPIPLNFSDLGLSQGDRFSEACRPMFGRGAD